VTPTPPWPLRAPRPPPFSTAGRCTITGILSDPACPALSLARAVAAPGVTTQLNARDATTECSVIRTGRGRIGLAGARADV